MRHAGKMLDGDGYDLTTVHPFVHCRCCIVIVVQWLRSHILNDLRLYGCASIMAPRHNTLKKFSAMIQEVCEDIKREERRRNEYYSLC